MDFIAVSLDKCKQCGSCRDECPAGLIRVAKGEPPTPTDDAEARCIDCGHCVAVCPEGALSHRSMAVSDCPPVRPDWILGVAEGEHFLRNRRSIRSFKETPVDRETIARVIDLARYAPSGHNRQPVRWLVVHESAELARLAGMAVDWMRYMVKSQPELAADFHFETVIADWEKGKDRVCRGAPHVIVAHAPKEERTAILAGPIAITFLDLAAPLFGLGACWGGYFTMAATYWPEMKAALALPKGHIPLGALMIGYPRHSYRRLMLRNAPQITWKQGPWKPA